MPAAPAAAVGHRRHHQQQQQLLLQSFHLLEVTIISAQDLPHRSASRPTYAVAWIDPEFKLATTASAGGGCPTWNEKVVFRVDDAFLCSETSAVVVELRAVRGRLGWARDNAVLGTVRIVVSSVRPSTSTRFVALQVRQPNTLYPHGILNLGITLIPARPLYFGIGSPPAFTYSDLNARPSPSRDASLNSTSPLTPMATGEEMRRSGSVAVKSRDGDKERELLESKLRKWRTDLSPIHNPREEPSRQPEDAIGEVKQLETRTPIRRRGSFSCFCGGGEWD